MFKFLNKSSETLDAQNQNDDVIKILDFVESEIENFENRLKLADSGPLKVNRKFINAKVEALSEVRDFIKSL